MQSKENQQHSIEEGWYIYDGQEVSGPINDKDFNDNYKSQSNLFASKKGFSKWYNIEELNLIFNDQDENNLSAEVREFQKFFQTSMKRLQTFNSPTTHESTAVRPTTIRKVKGAQIPSSLEQIMMEETVAAAAMQTPAATHDSVVTETPVTKKKTPQKNKSILKRSTKGQKKADPKNLYLTLRGRLRLGQIVNTFDIAFVNYLFTLSVSSFFWYRRVHQELVFHIWGKYTRGHFSDVLVLIPVLSCFKFYSLAKLIKQAETQNHYSKVIPVAAFMLGLIPPVAMSYLQEMTNRHWILHVVNVKRKTD